MTRPHPGRPRSEGGVWGSYVDYLDRVETERDWLLAEAPDELRERFFATRAEASAPAVPKPLERRVATPGVCADRMYASIGGRCCERCGQQIHHNGPNGWLHIATGQASCAHTPAVPGEEQA